MPTAFSLVELKNSYVTPTALVQSDIFAINERIGEYGMFLTEKEAGELAEVREKSLKDNERVEIGSGAAVKVAEIFARSTYISRASFASELADLIDLFYYIKTETRDSVSDDDLIETMFDFYENRCGGSFELLSGRELELIIRYFNNGKRKIFKIDEDNDYCAEPEGRDYE